MTKTHDYKAYEATTRFNHRRDLYAVVRQCGFDFISEAIVEIYRQKKSMRQTGRKLGLSRGAVAYHLKRLGEPTNGPGGWRPGDRRWGTVRKY